MAGEVLSQDEVENLLKIMANTAPPDVKPAAGGGGAAGAKAPAISIAASPSAWARQEKVTPYDFKRPERVGKDQMKTLQTMHEGF